MACRLSCSVTQTHRVNKAESDIVVGTMRNIHKLPVPSDFSYRGFALGGLRDIAAAVWTKLSKKKPFLSCSLFIQEPIGMSTHLPLCGNLKVINWIKWLSVNTSWNSRKIDFAIDQDHVHSLPVEKDPLDNLIADFKHQCSEVKTGESVKQEIQNECLKFGAIQKQKVCWPFVLRMNSS